MAVRVRRALAILLALTPISAAAQEPGDAGETDATPAEAAPDPAPAAKPDAPAKPVPDDAAKPARFAWEPYGYLRMLYVASQNDPNVQFVGRDDGFAIQNARLGVRGKLLDRAAFVVSIDGAVDERTQINVPEGKLRVGMRDAYGDFGFGQISVRAGFFQSLVDPESLVPDTRRAFVDKPLASRGVRATEGYETDGLTPGRSIGVALRNDPEGPIEGPRLGFELAVQNGADEYASNNDNDKPSASAAGLVRLPNDSHVVVAVRYNPRTVGDLPFRQDETDLQASGGAVVNAGLVSIGAAAIFTRTTFPTTGGPVRNSYGAHGQGLVNVGPASIGYRFCILDPSSLILTDRVMEHTVGAVLSVPTYRMRVQLQATHVVEQRELSNSRVELAAELAL